MNASADITIRCATSDDVTELGRVVFEATLSGTRVQKMVVQIANAGTYTYKPFQQLATVYGWAWKSDRPVSFSGAVGKFYCCLNDGATTGLPAVDVTISNTSGATANVELLVYGV